MCEHTPPPFKTKIIKKKKSINVKRGFWVNKEKYLHHLFFFFFFFFLTKNKGNEHESFVIKGGTILGFERSLAFFYSFRREQAGSIIPS